ncbi:hydantoinase B/oxoprolinase family protein [Paraburkholderia caballeronis]|uniref:hydantoinase B/oxoprolinase family protein n=1 Tax=Paraburkholderia caballeronis TaxID=416943 RepID=UPI001065E3AE|nr:hydantoinase B/oxoprolinase family protein [Paraburkholderia caballeronis]TDV11457.1 N-methylhydantoinase B [Paraburkholderia caballeronis]TDV14647.1 N-methylhydantoinase B [Paraburkholderia caballeronis]TDV23718.1 N-methylhydantoinase B [Paraburkholderia caballeronis]
MDIVTYEIIRSSLFAVAREMKIAMMRTAGSPLMHASGDSSAAIFDADMQLVAQGNDIPTMLGSAVISTRVSVETIGRENLRPGDVIVSNDAYVGGGNHQPDVQFTRPVFVDDRIVAFVMTRGHWTDIGGQTPGSYTVTTWDVFAEGIRIPPVLLYRNDEPVRDMLEILTRNSRNAHELRLDIQAQYAGTYVGDRRIADLVGKYGADALRDVMSQSLDHSEKLIRAEIARIPDGVYEAEEYLDPIEAQGWKQERPLLKVKVTVAGDEITFDYTGTGAQVRGGINCPLSVTCNSTWFTVKALTDLSIPINQGCYRPVKIIAPQGSVLNCEYPASVVSGNTETSPRVIDLLLKALSRAVPERIVGQSNCASCAGIFSGRDTDETRVRQTGQPFVTMHDVHAGGMGARADKDGVSGIRVYVGNAGSQSVEMIERTSPLMVEEWSLVTDSGGAGRRRGGLTSRRVYRVDYDEATFTVSGERGRTAPEGHFGGMAGTPFFSTVKHVDGSEHRVPAKGGQTVVHRGDRVVVQPAGSGGYGDPLERERERVLADIADGYVSEEAARRLYRVDARAGETAEAGADAASLAVTAE